MSEAQTVIPLVTNSEAIHRRVVQSKRRVCEVAAGQFVKNGYAATSIESIVAEAGLSRSTFYRFFKDKEDLVHQTLAPVFEQACASLAKIDPDRPETIVNGIADCYLEIWRDRRDALIFSANLGMALFPLIQDEHDAFANVVLSLMEKLNEARLLRNDDAPLAAIMVAQTAVRILRVCVRHPHYENVFHSTLRGMLLKW